MNHTDQSAFEAAALAVIKQGYPSMDKHGNCLYRGPNGRKCHLGQLIPDELYDVLVYESDTAQDLVKKIPEMADLDAGFLASCQSAHDGSSEFLETFVKDYINRLRNVASAYDLDASFLDAIVT